MTNWGFENDDDNGLGNNTELDGPKALRDAYAAQKKTIEDLSAKLTSFLEREEKSKVADVFKNLGIPGAENVYQGPADAKAAEEWAKSMQAVFGGGNGGNPNVAEVETEQAAAPTLPPSMQAQFERFSQAGNDGQALGNVEAAAGAIGDASSTADIVAAFERMQRM